MTALLLVGLAPVAVLAIRAGLQRPAILIALYAALLPFGSGWSFNIGLPRSFTSVSSLLALATMATLVGHFTIGRLSGVVRLQHPVWLAFIAITSLTILWSVDPRITAESVLTLAPLVLLAVLIGVTYLSREDLTLIEDGIVTGGAAAGVLAVGLLVAGTLPSTGAGVPRFELAGGGGAHGDANITAAMLLLPLAVALGRLSGPLDPRRRAVYALGGALVAVALGLTGSRGGLVAAAGMLVVLMVHARRTGRIALAVVPVVVIGLTLAAAPEALRNHVGKTHSSGRTDIWSIALQACPSYCAQGSGWGTFPQVYGGVLVSSPDARGGRDLSYEAHNVWLSAGIEGGLPTLLLLVAGVVLATKDILRTSKDLRAPPLAALTALLLTSAFLGTIEFKYFWLVIAYGSVAATVAGAAPVAVPATASSYLAKRSFPHVNPT